MHYTRWQTYGDPMIRTGPVPMGDESWPACDVAGCERRSRAQRGGMCFRHYQRQRNTGGTTPLKHYLYNADRDLLVADCEICGPRVPVLTRGNGELRCRASKQAQRLKYLYGVEIEIYDRIVEEQGGLCAICLREPLERHGQKRLFLDHDHVTGAVRGCLCGSCNIALGMIRDNAELAEKLAGYLRAHGATGYDVAAGESIAAAGTLATI